jgi:hypothetical protein
MLGPPNWSIRNCGSTLKDVGPNCTLLRKILGLTFRATLPGNARQLLWEFAKQNHLRVSGFESTSTARASILRRYSIKTQRLQSLFDSRPILGLLLSLRASAVR